MLMNNTFEVSMFGVNSHFFFYDMIQGAFTPFELSLEDWCRLASMG